MRTPHLRFLPADVACAYTPQNAYLTCCFQCAGRVIAAALQSALERRDCVAHALGPRRAALRRVRRLTTPPHWRTAAPGICGVAMLVSPIVCASCRMLRSACEPCLLCLTPLDFLHIFASGSCTDVAVNTYPAQHVQDGTDLRNGRAGARCGLLALGLRVV